MCGRIHSCDMMLVEIMQREATKLLNRERWVVFGNSAHLNCCDVQFLMFTVTLPEAVSLIVVVTTLCDEGDMRPLE